MTVAVQWIDDLTARFGEEVVTLGVMLAFCLLVVVLLLGTMIFLSRRQRRQDLRDVVSAIEELRAGGRGRVELPTRSPLAIVADSVNRLSQDVGVQLGRGERARRRLEALSAALSDSGILSANADWEIETFSEGASRLFGWSEDELRGQSASLLFTEPGWKELLPKLARRSLRRKGLSARTSMVTKAGRVLDAELTLRQLGDGGYVLVVRDVSEQVKVEADLRGAERRYRTLLDNLVQGVFVLQEGRVVYANPACATLVGREADGLTSTRLQEWIATEDVILVRETLSSVSAGSSEARSVPCTLVDPAGTPTARVRLQARPIEEGGRPAALVAVIDETRVRRAGEVLQRTAAHLDAVLEAAEDGIVLVVEGDGASRVEMANAAFGRLTGLDAAETLGTSVEQLVDALREVGGGIDAIGAFLLAGADEDTVEIGGETPRMLDLHASALADVDGRTWGRVLLVRDVTDRRAVERRLRHDADELRRSKRELEVSYEELRAVNEELGQRSQQVDDLNEELRKLDRMKSKMLADVSHELQTPLVSIRGYTEMILKGRLGEITEEQRKGLTLSLGNIDRLIGMIDRLLAYARLEREGDTFEPADFPLAPVIDEAVELVRGQAAEADVGLSRTIEDPGLAVHGDRDRLLQVFLNLLTNGIKFNRPGGRVEIEARPGAGGRVRLRVADTGVGIPAEERERIFEHFYRSEATAEEQGSGIGLSIVKRILERHGSKIELDSQPGRGTIIQFELPQAELQRPIPPPLVEDDGLPDPEPPRSGERPRLRIIRSRRSD